ncbi:Gfo/Idh/MocA family protein [Gulosibacter sp. 10]|uniref:Gfo/Idh/MocA family protein n=1 Tax=Gulosibacter sp. 10 TaxID=1255570 RepID=UPI00097F5D22|nr:Gfo/Idh/MocA family oxidoreductase [Gulosibacter sp. 10]SJM59209.1 putative oxidoreductase [Gulosibacter sp. 10]
MTTTPELRLPEPRTPDPKAAPALRWGVLGTGWIAERFVAALHAGTRQRVVAVGSRSQESADRFAAEVGAERAHPSYAALVEDAEVDVVYIATPHTSHFEYARLAIEAGKHVLIEKPMTINAAQARELRELVRARGVFAMEALWSLFLPRFDIVRQVLESGALGRIRAVIADNGEWFPEDHRIMRTDLAGGPMLDLGTYPYMLVNWVLGAHEQAHAFGQRAPSGVNGQTAAITRHAGDAQAVVHTTILGASPTAATIVGEEATIELPGPFYMPGDVVLRAADGAELDRWTEPSVKHEALHFQAAEVARRIAEGSTESPYRTLDDTISTLETMDEVRRLSGETFDGA